jgi:glycosyltransferase involved in cell wall biosynthesis
MKNKVIITVVIAVCNKAKTLQRSIDSVVNQSLKEKELIIMDGGSADGSVEILQKSNNKIDYWESKADRGIYHAFNKAIKHSTGDWIYFLGADDYLWDNDVLEQMAKILSEIDETIDIVYGKVCVVTANNEIIRNAGIDWSQAQSRLKQYMCILHQGVFHRKRVFALKGCFDESFLIAGDYEFLLRVLKDRSAFFIDDMIIAGMELGGISTNRNYGLRMLKENYKAKRINGYQPLSVYLIKGFIFTFLRAILSMTIGEERTRKLAIMRGRLIGQKSNWEYYRDD